jgi:predicted RNase H-like HicB family nuclease
MTTRTFTAVLHKEDDWYVAECPEVGTVSQGHTIDEAIGNLKEATELYLEEFPTQEFSKSMMTTFEAVVNA